MNKYVLLTNDLLIKFKTGDVESGKVKIDIDTDTGRITITTDEPSTIYIGERELFTNPNSVGSWVTMSVSSIYYKPEDVAQIWTGFE